MTPNDKLPEEIIKQIEQESNDKLERQKELAENERDMAYAQGESEGYATGATAYAPWKVKYDELKQEILLLKEINVEALKLTEKAQSERQQLQDRSEKIETALQQFVSYHETGLLPCRFTYLKGVEALKKEVENA